MAKFHSTRITDSHNDKMPMNSRKLSVRTKQLLAAQDSVQSPNSGQ